MQQQQQKLSNTMESIENKAIYLTRFIFAPIYIL